MVATTHGNASLPDRSDLFVAGGLALAALALFLWRIGDPAKAYFDETHYLPAARILMAMDALPNAEHPPLGKWLIGIGVALFGDTPGGWRTMSALFGALTVFSATQAARWLFLRRPAAVMTALLMMLVQTLYVQARIAMLDIFMTGFLFTGFWLLLAFWRTGFTSRWRLIVGSACLGLATACKWTTVPFLALGLPLLLWLRWRASVPGETRAAEGTRPVPLSVAMAWLGPFSLLVYLATFLPYSFLRNGAIPVAQIPAQQLAMLKLQSAPMDTHPYQSAWWQWVLDARPVWYFYEALDSVQRGVLFIGNPAICWGGLAALLACLWAGLREGAKPLLVPVLFWAGPLVFFMLAPKPVQFYYHYFPSSLMLCFAIGGALDHFFYRRGDRLIPWLAIGLAALVFIEFMPIISAGALGDPQDFNRWMWFDSWR